MMAAVEGEPRSGGARGRPQRSRGPAGSARRPAAGRRLPWATTLARLTCAMALALLILRGLAELALHDEAARIRGPQDRITARAPLAAGGAATASAAGVVDAGGALLRGHPQPVDAAFAVTGAAGSQQVLTGDPSGLVRLSRETGPVGVDAPGRLAAWAHSALWAPLGRPAAHWALNVAAQVLPLSIPAEAQGRALSVFRDCPGCPEMVALTGGLMLQGSPLTEALPLALPFTTFAPDEGPRRLATLPPFAVGRFEVTFEEYDACVSDGGCAQEADDSGWGRGRRPVINVSWADAQDYVAWLSGKTGHRYRLLSESEWEYAARAGTTTRWSFGDAESQLGGYAWFSSNSGGRTQPVGGKRANPWGLYDMHGNVWEWVEDCYDDSLASTPTNGAPNSAGSCALRVSRGGSWYISPDWLRSAGRVRDAPANRDYFLGFRVARSL